jgi:hypothetical protein
MHTIYDAILCKVNLTEVIRFCAKKDKYFNNNVVGGKAKTRKAVHQRPQQRQHSSNIVDEALVVSWISNYDKDEESCTAISLTMQTQQQHRPRSLSRILDI